MKGQTLVELILVMGMAAIILPALLTGFVASRNGKPQQQQRLQAVTVLKESEAAVRNIRNSNWAAFATNGTYHTQISGTQWGLVSGSSTNTDGIKQEVIITDVKRDATGAIITTGGTIDSSTKKVTITISWTKPSTSSISSDMYVTNRKNLTQTQTLAVDFNGGTKSSTVVTNTAGGEVALAQSVGAADWCSPQSSIVTQLSLPKKGNSIIAPSSAAYIGTGDGTAGVSFVNVGVNYAIPPNPPTASVVASYSGNYQTNAVYSDGTYAFLAINGSAQQVRILNISAQPYTEIGTITVPGGVNANGVYVSGDIAYVTSGDKLYKFDVSSKVGSHTTVLDQTDMWLNIGESPIAKQVMVVGSKVYVGTGNTLFGLQVFRTSDLKVVGVSNLTWGQSAQGLYVNAAGTRGYIAFNNGGFFSKGFFIVDTSPPDPSGWWAFLPNFYNIIGTYNSGTTDPRSMAIAPGTSNKALIGGIGGTYEYQVINIANESNPVFCGGLDIPNGVTGIAGANDSYSNVFSYLLTGDTTNQFRIIQGGAGGGGGGYAASGTFASSLIDVGSSAVFNRFVATVNQQTNTTIKMQVGVAPVGGSGNCTSASFTYVGPDGSTASYFNPTGTSIAGTIPLGNYVPSYQNPARCFSYKAYLTSSDTTKTSKLEDVVVNYSP